MNRLVIILLVCSCRSTPALRMVPADYDSLKVVVARTDSVVRVIPDFIGKRLLIEHHALMVNDTINRLKIDAQSKEITALRESLKKQTDTIMRLKNRALIPSPADFRMDTIKGILYIKRQ